MMLSNGGVVSADDAARVADPPRRVRARRPVRWPAAGSPGGSARTACCASTWAARPPSRASSSDGEPELTQHVRGRPHLPLQEGLGLPGVGAVGRPRRDRRRRRQPGPRRRARPAEGRPGVGGRRSRPGLLRPRRHASRRSPTPTSLLGLLDAGYFLGGDMPLDVEPRRAGRSDRSPTALGLPADDTAGGHPRARQPEHGRGRRACTPSSRASTCAACRCIAFGGAGPGARVRRGRAGASDS